MSSEPLPREQPAPYQAIVWPAGSVVRLSPRTAPLDVELVSLLEQRQTRREFARGIGNATLGEFLWLTLRSRSSWASPYGPDQESRPYPSAGALHPIHVLVGTADAPWHRYDPSDHALIELPRSTENASLVRRDASQLVDLGAGVLLALVAEQGKTASKYINSESLIWRDAGVVLGYMSLVAEAMGLPFCPLGLTGNPRLGDVLEPPAELFGAALAVLGG